MSNTWEKWGVLLKDAGENVLYWFDMAFDNAWENVEYAGDCYRYPNWHAGRKYWDVYNEYLNTPLCEVHSAFDGYRDFNNACYDFVEGE